jgi:hypothetical protein
MVHKSRLVDGEPFFRMQEGPVPATPKPPWKCARSMAIYGAMACSP